MNKYFGVSLAQPTPHPLKFRSYLENNSLKNRYLMVLILDKHIYIIDQEDNPPERVSKRGTWA